MSYEIAYVAKVFPRNSETFVINELRALEELGETPVVFSLHRNPSPVHHGILSALRAPTHVVEDVAVPDRDVRDASDRLAKRLGIEEPDRGRYLPRKYVRLAVAIHRLCAELGVRHLHAHFASRAGHVARLAATLADCGYSLTAHAKDIWHRDVDDELLAWKIVGARFAVTVTEHNLRHLERLAGTTASLVRLYNGVDLERFDATSRAASQPPLILAVGRLVEKKGFSVLIDACAALRDAGVAMRCEIVGGGELEAALQHRIADRGLAGIVTLAGSRTTEEVAERMRRASVVVLPCIVGADGNVDALPTALLEGMACGVPLVSTSLAGIPEIIDGTNGLLVEPGDSAGLASALQTILDDPSLAASMSRAGRRIAEERFDLRRNVATLRTMLRSALDGGRLAV